MHLDELENILVRKKTYILKESFFKKISPIFISILPSCSFYLLNTDDRKDSEAKKKNNHFGAI